MLAESPESHIVEPAESHTLHRARVEAGRKGGRSAAGKLTPAELSERGRAGGLACWRDPERGAKLARARKRAARQKDRAAKPTEALA